MTCPACPEQRRGELLRGGPPGERSESCGVPGYGSDFYVRPLAHSTASLRVARISSQSYLNA
jgi:hypothetical protein